MIRKNKMKTLSVTIFVLCLAISLNAWDYQRNNNFYWDFTEELSDWRVDVNCDTFIQSNRLEFHGLDVRDGDYVQLASIRFHPEHYGADFEDHIVTSMEFEGDTFLKDKMGYPNNNRHQVKFYYEFSLFMIPDIQIYEVDEPAIRIVKERASLSEINISTLLELNESIKEIRLCAEIHIDPDYEFFIWVRNISIEKLIKLNPEYEDLCELYVGRNKYEYTQGDQIEFLLHPIYYGLKSQMVDIYFVFYNNVDLYFFPSMGIDVDYVSLFLPQFTMSRETFVIGSVNINDLNPVEGTNYYATGIAPSGTLDFLNDVVTGKIIYLDK